MSIPSTKDAIKRKRELEHSELLVGLEGMLELPMVALSLLMLVLFVIELTVSLSAEWQRTFNLAQWFIWVAFVMEYVVKLAIARDKKEFLSDNWLMTLSIILPVFRVFRIARAARAIRSLGALRVITVGNRTIRQLKVLFDRRRLQYVGAVMLAVTVIGAAGIYYLERNVPNSRITTFGDAMWWSAGIVTTVGTELFPISAEGRVLAVVLMVFGVSIFGYIAGSLASLFMHMDDEDAEEEKRLREPGTEEDFDDLLAQIQRLEATVVVLDRRLHGQNNDIDNPLA